MPAFLALLAIQVATWAAGTLLKSMLRKTPESEDIQFPTVDEGTPIPIVWGIGQIAPIITCVGAIRKETHNPLAGAPYVYYYARMQGVVCIGKVDELNDIQFGERSIRLYHWTDGDNGDAADAGSNTDVLRSGGAAFSLPYTSPPGSGGYTTKVFSIHARQLFGGKHQQGGIEGDIQWVPGQDNGASSPVASAILTSPAGDSHQPGLCMIDFGAISGEYNTDGAFYWSANTPTPPPVTLIVGRRPCPLYAAVNGTFYDPNPIGVDANPMEMLYELLTDAPATVIDPRGIGAGIAAALVDATGMQTASDTLKAEQFGLSYVWTRATDRRTVVNDILRHIDGELYQDPETGLLTVGLARQDYVVADLLEITPSNARELEFDRQGWRETVNEVRIRYRQYDGGTNGAVTGESLTTAVQNLFDGLTAFARYQCQGRNISAYTVHNTTQVIDLVDGTDYSVDVVTGTFTFPISANVALGDALTVDYTAAPTFVGFRDATAQAQDLGNKQATGEVRSLTLDFPMITRSGLAQYVANRELSKRCRPLATARWKMSRAGHGVRPCGVVKLTWSDYDLSELPMRVVSVDYGTVEDDFITVEAMEDVWGVALADYAGGTDIGHTGGTCPVPVGVSVLTDAANGDYVSVYGAGDTSLYGVDFEYASSVSATSGTSFSPTLLYAGRTGDTRSIWKTSAGGASSFVRARHTDAVGSLAASDWTHWTQVISGDKNTITGTPAAPVVTLSLIQSEADGWTCQLAWSAADAGSVKFAASHLGYPTATQVRAGTAGSAFGNQAIASGDMLGAESELTLLGDPMDVGMFAYVADPSGTGAGLESPVTHATTGNRTGTGVLVGGSGVTLTPGGGGTTVTLGLALALDDLTDVNAPAPSNGDVLTWDSTPGEWIPAVPSGGGAVSSVFGRTGAVVAVAGDYPATKGGTGQTTYATGDLLYASASNTLSKLAAGTNGYALVQAAGVPAWVAQLSAFPIVIGDGSAAIPTGIMGDIEIPFACIITAVRLFSTVSGSIVIDLWKDTYANYPPTVADTITASAKPTLSSATKSQDSTLTGWTTTVSAGDILRVNVDSASTVTQVTLSLTVRRT